VLGALSGASGLPRGPVRAACYTCLGALLESLKLRGKPECIGTLATGLRCCGVERAGAAFWCGAALGRLRWYRLWCCAGSAGACLVPGGKVLRRRRQMGGDNWVAIWCGASC
jgi:hypothetical protein